MLLAGGRQHRGCIIPQTVTHSLVLLKMGKIISRNMLSWLELLISRYCYIYLVVYIIYINDAIVAEMELQGVLSWVRWNSMEFHLIHHSSQPQYRLTIREAVRTVMCSWWWAEEPPETYRASVEINKSRKVASCWL